jgi:hypothetical protein
MAAAALALLLSAGASMASIPSSARLVPPAAPMASGSFLGVQPPGEDIASVELEKEYPPSVAGAIRENAGMCEVFAAYEGFSRNDVDLNGDGIKDWLIDYDHVTCDGSVTFFCGSGGCTLQVLLSTAPGKWEMALEATVQRHRVTRRGKRNVLRLDLHGIHCGKVGAASCSTVMDFNKRK